jgi:hypothetical protein
MSQCAMCSQVKYPDQEPKVFDRTKRLVHIWWDTSVWICYECWCTYRVDALLAPVRFMISSNRQYREEDTTEQEYTDGHTGIRLNIEQDIPEHPKVTISLPDGRVEIEQINEAIGRLLSSAGLRGEDEQ